MPSLIRENKWQAGILDERFKKQYSPSLQGEALILFQETAILSGSLS